MTLFIYYNLNSQIARISIHNSKSFSEILNRICLVIQVKKEISDLYFSNQTRFHLKGCLCFQAPSPDPGLLLQFVFTGSGSQFVFTGTRPSIRIYLPWLIRIGNTCNKSQRLHIMLLFLFLLSNFFVTLIVDRNKTK